VPYISKTSTALLYTIWKVDKLSMFKNVHFSSSYATRPISDILELYFKTKRYNHKAMFKNPNLKLVKCCAPERDGGQANWLSIWGHHPYRVCQRIPLLP
jgi:hypothetical protein